MGTYLDGNPRKIVALSFRQYDQLSFRHEKRMFSNRSVTSRPTLKSV